MAALVALAATGCSTSTGTSPSGGSGKIQAVVTVGMVADLVREIGGEQVEVTQLMGPTVDPHLFVETSSDVTQLRQAGIVFYCGLMLEGKMSATLERLAAARPVFAVADRLDKADILHPDGAQGHPDPHAWMNVSLWAKCAVIVGDLLAKHDPAHAADYKARAEAYAGKLKSLHEYGVKALGSIPSERRVLITSHDAFNYFGKAYGLEVEGVQGISTESEAGLKRVQELVDMIVTRRVPAVFVESSVSEKNIKALVDGVRARGVETTIGGELFSDAMGEAGTYEGTYVGMLDHNITTVARALGGEAPERGFQGRLGKGK